MELFGRISHIKGDFFTVFGAKTGKEYKCKYRKLPIALSDSIYAKVEQKDGYYKIISYPWVEISNDPDVVETFFDFFKLNGAAIYKALLDKYKTVPELISNIDELASAPSDPKFSFPHTSPKMTLFFLKRWKTERNIRQLKLYGLSEVEIYTFSKYAVKTIPEMIKICRIDPLKFFNIKDEVVQHLCQVFQVVPTFVLVESRKLAKKCYEALLKSQSYLPFTGNVTDINDGVVIEDHKVYLPYPYKIEKFLRAYVKNCKKIPDDPMPENIPEKLSENQKRAFILGIRKYFTLIVGCAGSGKSTLIESYFNYFKEIKKTVAVCSYTGKAVANLRALLKNNEPRTLHSLYYRMRNEKIKIQVLIVDEVSMATAEILYLIIQNLGEVPKIILLGDPNQLPPIKWGAINLDRYDVKLSYCYRFKGDILKIANGILEDKEPKDKGNFNLLNGNIDSAIQLYESLISEYQVQIITPYKNDMEQINKRIQKLHKTLRTQNRNILDSKGTKWYEGDKIIFKKNYDKMDVFNGEEGVITGIGDKAVEVLIGKKELELSINVIEVSEEEEELDWDKEIKLTTGLISLSYCLTIHKSQGSQWPIVIFYFPRYSKAFTTKNLIYTAITRSQKGCFVVGDIEGFKQGCKNLVKNFSLDLKL